MVAYTPRDVVTMALKDIGAAGEGQPPSAEIMNEGMTRLLWMMSQWQRKRWLIWHLVDIAIPSTGALFYTIGPTGSDVVYDPRPDQIQSAFLRQNVPSQPNLVDYPLELINSWEDYSRITLKTLGSFPAQLFYDSGFPQGKIYPWPVPQATIYSVHIQVKEQLTQFGNLSESIMLPEEYLAALEYNLAIRLAMPIMAQQASPDLKALAKDALNVLRNANTQMANLKMPKGLPAPGIYNIFSDQVR